MTALSPPEAFRVQPSHRRPVRTLPAAVRAGNVAMAAGAVALVAGVVIELSEGLLAAGAPGLFLTVARLEGPLLACGQVLLVGGAVAARLARRRAARSALEAAHDHGRARTGDAP